MDDADEKPAVTAVQADERRPFEEWAKEKQTDAWKVSAAKALRSWPLGQEMTEAAFDQAVNDACNHVIR